MHAFDPNKYIGIPYADGGRTQEGADCWGLLRLIYQNEFGIELPGHDGIDRGTRTDGELTEYMAAHRENWERIREPSAGDIVLLRMAGEPIHVGVVTAPGWFIHSRADNDVVVEKYTGTRWSHRIEGFYRYAPKADGVTLSGCPHPLKMQRIDRVSDAGGTLHESILHHCAAVPVELIKNGVAFVNGKRIPFVDWKSVVLVDGDRVEFRLLPGKSRDEALLGQAVVMGLAWWAGGAFASAWQGAAAAGAPAAGWGLGTGISAGVAGSIAQGAVSLLGSAFLNALAPAQGPASQAPIKPQYMLAGGANTATPYAAIPVVLGTHDFTPPLGAQTYMSSDGSDRFLHLILVWGYGPLDVTNLRIGQTPISNFEDVTMHHIQGDANEFVDGHLDWTRQEVKNLLNLYGSDITQERPEVEITETFDTRTTQSTNLNRLSFLLNFPQGLTNMDHFNEDMGELRPQSVTVVFEYRRIGYFNTSGVWVPVSEAWKDNFATVPGMAKTAIGVLDAEVRTYPGGIIVLRDRTKVVYKPKSTAFGNYELPNNPADNELLLYTIKNGAMFSQHNTGLYTGFTLSFQTVVETVTEDTPFGGSYDRTITTRFVTVGTGSVSDFNQFTDATRQPFDKIIDIHLDAEPGQYQYQLKRTTPETTIDGAADKVVLMAVTEYSDNVKPVNPPKPLAMTALKIRMTDQLNGSLEGITGTCSSRQLCWNGTAWVTPGANTRRNNPASLMLYVLRHPANAKPVPYSQIDMPALQHFSEWCDAKGYVYENVITSQRPLKEIIAEIAAAGRASLAMPDGKWSVVIDEPKSTIAQHFTPSNSWGFKGTRLLPKRPHALRCQFRNRRKDYQPDEMLIYADGYNASNATLIESIDLPGVTQPIEDNGSPGPVWKLGRHHMEQIILRPEEYELYSDIEAIICTRGDRVKVNHDIPMWGLGSGRIKSVIGNVTGVVVDEPMQMEAGKNYTIRWRTAGNATNTATITGANGVFTTLNFTTTISANKPAAGDTFMFGELNSEAVDCLVKAVEPLPGLQARLVLCDYAPAVFDAETKPFGTWDSQITEPPPLLRLAINQKPIISKVVTDEQALIKSGNSYVSNILVKFSNARATNSLTNAVEAISKYVVSIEAQYRLSGSVRAVWKTVPIAQSKGGLIYVGPMTDKNTYDIRVRFIGADGRMGPWVTQTSIYVTGKSNPPPDVASFLINDKTLTWTKSAAKDVIGYLLRFQQGSNREWGTASKLHEGVITDSPFTLKTIPVGQTTVMIKAVDATGLESRNAAVIITNFGDALTSNVVETYDFKSAGFPGTITNATVAGGNLQANTSSLFYGAGAEKFYKQNAAPFYVDNYYGFEYVTSVYTPANAASGRSLMLFYQASSGAVEVLYRMDGPEPFYGDAIDDFYGDDSSAFYDPPSEWYVWPGSVVAMNTGYQFKVRSLAGAVQGVLSTFNVVVDVPDKVLRLNDVAIGSSGTRLAAAIGQFSVIKNISLTLQNSTADRVYAEDKNPTLGPMIKATAAGSGVSAIVDVTLQGYK